MKIIHLSDLHLGKRLNDFLMHEDQKDILEKIIGMIDTEKPQAVIIAGDVYDRSVPPAESVALFDDFLVRLAERKLEVFVISGNHDSAERIAFGGRLMNTCGIHMSPVYDGNVEPVVLSDSFGEVCFYMLPFVRPANVRRFFEDEEIETFTDAMKTAVSHMNIDTKKRNVLITHQFVTGASVCDSEDITVGGSDNVDASVFEIFDYTALGHIHGPQDIPSKGGKIRYCGTPLKYSISEKDHDKSVTVVEINEKGNVDIKPVSLSPLHDLREIRGTYEELTLLDNYKDTDVNDYIHVVLTDEEDVADALAKLRLIYPNILKLSYDNTRTRTMTHITAFDDTKKRSETEIFAEFYESQNGKPMSDEQLEFTKELFRKLKEEMI